MIFIHQLCLFVKNFFARQMDKVVGADLGVGPERHTGRSLQ